MKKWVVSIVLSLSSLSQAAVHFTSYTDLPDEVQKAISSAILQQCPMAREYDWEFYEYSTEDSRAGDGILFKTEFSVDGMDEYKEPQNGNLTVETFMMVGENQIKAQVLSLKGLCR